MQITGTIKVIKETNQISEKFAKREFVLIDDSGMYAQELQMEFTQDKVSVLDNYVEGERVTVEINILGRMWTSPQGEDKYFVTLQAWRIEKTEGGSPQGNEQTPAIKPPDDSEDLPF
jgi:hypothetical protein